MACAFAFVAIAGFVPTYWAPVAAGTFAGGALLHLHGLLFTAWTILFIVQATLAARGRYERHRMLGMAGILVATAMLIVGVVTAVHRMESAAGTPYLHEARAFANVRRPDVHMRLMPVAGINILPPPLARMVRLLLAPANARNPMTGARPPVEFSLMPAIASNLFLVAAIVYDWRARGRPHPVYLVAGALLLVVQFGRVPLATTPAWHAAAEWLVRLLG